MNTVSVLHLVKDAIAANDYEIVVVPVNLECHHIRVSNDNLRIAVKFREFRFDVTECAAYRESTGEDTMWTQYNLALKTTNRLLDINDGGILVDSAVIAEDSFHFNLVGRLMII